MDDIQINISEALSSWMRETEDKKRVIMENLKKGKKDLCKFKEGFSQFIFDWDK